MKTSLGRQIAEKFGRVKNQKAPEIKGLKIKMPVVRAREGSKK